MLYVLICFVLSFVVFGGAVVVCLFVAVFIKEEIKAPAGNKRALRY